MENNLVEPDSPDGLDPDNDEVLESESESETESGDPFDGSEYAAPGEEAEFLAIKEAWKRGEVVEEDLPSGAVSYDKHGRKIIFGKYAPKIGTDVSRGIKRTAESLGGVSPNFKPSLEKPLPSIRCISMKKDGDRCGRWSIRGAAYCLVHGGRLPTVKKAAAAAIETARMRLVGLTDDAVDVLEDLTRSGTADAIRLKAATEILDRAGVKGALDINIEVEHKIDASTTIAEKLLQISKRSADPEDLGVIDAEVVDGS